MRRRISKRSTEVLHSANRGQQISYVIDNDPDPRRSNVEVLPSHVVARAMADFRLRRPGEDPQMYRLRRAAAAQAPYDGDTGRGDVISLGYLGGPFVSLPSLKTSKCTPFGPACDKTVVNSNLPAGFPNISKKVKGYRGSDGVCYTCAEWREKNKANPSAAPKPAPPDRPDPNMGNTARPFKPEEIGQYCNRVSLGARRDLAREQATPGFTATTCAVREGACDRASFVAENPDICPDRIAIGPWAFPLEGGSIRSPAEHRAGRVYTAPKEWTEFLATAAKKLEGVDTSDGWLSELGGALINMTFLGLPTVLNLAADLARGKKAIAIVQNPLFPDEDWGLYVTFDPSYMMVTYKKVPKSWLDKVNDFIAKIPGKIFSIGEALIKQVLDTACAAAKNPLAQLAVQAKTGGQVTPETINAITQQFCNQSNSSPDTDTNTPEPEEEKKKFPLKLAIGVGVPVSAGLLYLLLRR